MNTIKRILAIMLVAVMAVACYAVSVSAATSQVTVTVSDGSVELPDADKLAKLLDGKRALDATAFSDEDLVAFKNTGFEHTDGVDAAVEATLTFVLDLGEAQAIGGVYMDFFKDSNSMVALPTEVTFEVSLDGKNYYDISSEAGVAIDEEAEENKTATLTSNSTSRIALNVRYIKATVTFKNGWLFISELGVDAGTEGVQAVNPDYAFDYTEHSCLDVGIGVFTGDGSPFDLNTSESGRPFKNAQVMAAEYDEAKQAYKIIFNEVNVWTEEVKGHPTSTLTLEDNQIMIVISTGGVVNADKPEDSLFSIAKWLARGLEIGDYVVLKDGKLSLVPAENFVAVDPGDSSSDESDSASSDETSSEETSSDETSPVDTSSTATSVTASSDDTTSMVPGGDTGIIVFAVLGVLAVIGVAVVVKARR